MKSDPILVSNKVSRKPRASKDLDVTRFTHFEASLLVMTDDEKAFYVDSV